MKLEVIDNQSLLTFLKALNSILADSKNAAKVKFLKPKTVAAIRLIIGPISKMATLIIANSSEETGLQPLFDSFGTVLCKELNDILESVKDKLIQRVVSLDNSVDKDVLAKFLVR